MVILKKEGRDEDNNKELGLHHEHPARYYNRIYSSSTPTSFKRTIQNSILEINDMQCNGSEHGLQNQSSQFLSGSAIY